MNLTDNEIIKALDCCANGVCAECPKVNSPVNVLMCQGNLIGEALEFINRLQAEIKELKEEKHILSQKRANIFEITSAFDRGRTDGIIKFAERLKETIEDYQYVIDNLVKEMVGDTE